MSTSYFQGRAYEVNRTTVSLTGTPDGSGTTAVTFATPFIQTPEILVVGSDAITGSVSAASATKTGFTVTCTSIDNVYGQDVRVYWVAFEKGIDT